MATQFPLSAVLSPAFAKSAATVHKIFATVGDAFRAVAYDSIARASIYIEPELM